MNRSVTLAPAGRSDHELIANLMQLYLHDLSEFTPEPVSESGIFEYPYLDLYWLEPERHPFLILACGETAGFALVRELEPQVHELAEFFILRRYRGQNIGGRAANELFMRFTGRWHVAQEEANVPAQRFWRKVIGEFTDGDFSEERSEQPAGPRQVFSSSGSGRQQGES